MPDRRRHRGPHPRDPALFGPDQVPTLRRAMGELEWLLDRDYPPAASLKLVGDRHALVERQRKALSRAACAPERARARLSRRVEPGAVVGQELWLDGFNVITTVEVALSGGVVLLSSDGCARDIAGVHGSYRRVEETAPALALIADMLVEWELARCRFLLDRPVSNSRRLRAMLLALAAERGAPFEVDLVDDPDRVLRDADALVASADSAILDGCGRWLNLAAEVIERRVSRAWRVDLRPPRGGDG